VTLVPIRKMRKGATMTVLMTDALTLPKIRVEPLPAYFPGCGHRIERLARHVVRPWSLVRCHCGSEVWRHALHRDAKRAKADRKRATAFRRRQEQ